MGLKELAVQRQDIFYIDPCEITVLPGWNARNLADPANREHIEALSRSIAEVGIKEPLTVFNREGKTCLSDGHCRLAATHLAISRGAAIASVPVKTEPRGSNEADWAFSQALRNTGKPLTPFELGEHIKRQIGYGWAVEKIAAQLGKSCATVNAALDLQEAPPEIAALVADGRISATLATKTLRKEGASAAVQTLHDAVDNATQRGASRATARDIGASPKPPRVNKATRVAEILNGCDVVEEDVELKGEQVAVVMTRDEWAEIAKLLDI